MPLSSSNYYTCIALISLKLFKGVTNTSLRGPKGEGLRCVYCENSKLRSRSRVVQEVGGFIWRSLNGHVIY